MVFFVPFHSVIRFSVLPIASHFLIFFFQLLQPNFFCLFSAATFFISYFCNSASQLGRNLVKRSSGVPSSTLHLNYTRGFIYIYHSYHFTSQPFAPGGPDGTAQPVVTQAIFIYSGASYVIESKGLVRPVGDTVWEVSQ